MQVVTRNAGNGPGALVGVDTDTLGGKGMISLPTDIPTISTTPLLLIYLEGETPLNCVCAINATIGDALIQHTCFWVLSMTTYKTSV
jgi:hypothetical protein